MSTLTFRMTHNLNIRAIQLRIKESIIYQLCNTRNTLMMILCFKGRGRLALLCLVRRKIVTLRNQGRIKLKKQRILRKHRSFRKIIIRILQNKNQLIIELTIIITITKSINKHNKRLNRANNKKSHLLTTISVPKTIMTHKHKITTTANGYYRTFPTWTHQTSVTNIKMMTSVTFNRQRTCNN